MIAHRDGDRMVLATGDSRPIEHWFGDGAHFSCPWCGTGQAADEDVCPNPMCVASRWADEEYAQASLAGQAAEDERRRQAQRLSESIDRSREARESARRAAWEAVATEAAERGACLICLRKSPWESDHPRFVRHRSPDFHDRSAE